jgi:hypothetical protein
MRRVLAIAASVALMLAAGDTALTQTPSMQLQVQQIQPKIRPAIKPRVQPPIRSPNLTLIKPSQAINIAQRFVPNSKAVGVKLLPGGNYAVTLKRNKDVQRLIIDGQSGEVK